MIYTADYCKLRFNAQSDLEADGAAVGEVASGGVELADGAHL